MLKKDTLGKASAKSLEDVFKCGECLHFKTSCSPRKEGLCSANGVKSFAIAPACFTPDVTAVVKNAEEFAVLASLYNSYTPKQRRLLVAIIKGNKTVKPSELFKFGQKVFLRLGRDVLTNYYCAYVVGYTSGGELILTGNADRKSAGKSFFAYLKTTEHLLTCKEWKAKRQQLIADCAFTDLKGTPNPADKYTNYEVPTIDSNPEAFDKPKRKVNKRTIEITEFIVSR